MICNRCQIDKPLNQFCKSTHTKSGVQQPCKTCFNEAYTRESRQKPVPLSMVCRECRDEKPLHEFHRNKRYRTGYSETCETCFRTVLPTSMTCTHCGIDQPMEEYARDTNRRLGRQQPCRSCRLAANRNRAEERRANPPAKPPLPALVLCAKCGEQKPLQDFPPDSRTRTGHGQPCVTCVNAHVCNQCGEAKTPESFQADSRYRAGHHPTCTDCRNALQQQWRTSHLAHVRAQRRRSYANDPERHRAYAKTWRTSNPAHHTQQLVRGSRRRARLRNLPATFTTTDQAFMMQYWNFSCAVCGNEEGFDWTIAGDHWIAVSSPNCPGTIATNMIPLCHTKQGNHLSCNSTKYNRDPVEWLTERVGKRKARTILKAIDTYFDVVRQRQSLQEGAAD